MGLKLLGHYRHKIEYLCINSNRSHGRKVASDIFLAFYKLRKITKSELFYNIEYLAQYGAQLHITYVNVYGLQ